MVREDPEVCVAGRELGPGVADADHRPAVELVLRHAAVLDPAPVDEAVDVLAAEPLRAAALLLGHQYVARPPEMSNTAPVENEHSSEASQQTSAAISSTLTKRPMGIFDTMYLANSGVTCPIVAVCAAAGVTQLTRTPVCARSLPSTLVNA